MYYKSNGIHTSRRTWYLPIAPTPDHPDANSKKTKKRFPTLKLDDGASLRSDSYINIRFVYKIDWALLESYIDPGATDTQVYHFLQDSLKRLLAKSKTLTLYDPGQQFQDALELEKPTTKQAKTSSMSTQTVELDTQKVNSQVSESETTDLVAESGASDSDG